MRSQRLKQRYWGETVGMGPIVHEKEHSREHPPDGPPGASQAQGSWREEFRLWMKIGLGKWFSKDPPVEIR